MKPTDFNQSGDRCSHHQGVAFRFGPGIFDLADQQNRLRKRDVGSNAVDGEDDPADW